MRVRNGRFKHSCPQTGRIPMWVDNYSRRCFYTQVDRQSMNITFMHVEDDDLGECTFDAEYPEYRSKPITK